MERKQLIRILALDRNLIRLSNDGRLIPPDNVACYGLDFGDGNINKMDCKFCRYYKPKPLSYTYPSVPTITITIDISQVKPYRSNITGRYLCPFCLNKEIDKIDEKVYFKKNLNLILDLYDKITLKPLEEEWNRINL